MFHQQRVPLLFLGLPQFCVQGHLAALGQDLAGIEHPSAQPGRLDGLSVQPLPRLQFGQLQHALDQLLHAGCLQIDVADKTGSHLGWRRLGQYFPCPANGGQRALELVGQAVYIGFDVGLAVQLATHGFQGAAEPIQFRAVEAWQAGGLTLADRIGVVHQLADGAVEPPHQQGADQQRDEQQQGRPLQQLVFAALYHGQQGTVGLGDGEGAEDVVPLPQRCGHVHHRTGGIVGVAAGAAGAVFPAQGAIDIVPA